MNDKTKAIKDFQIIEKTEFRHLYNSHRLKQNI